ncbi:hypothetical protein Taro_026814 [Colocasia esculenta]|uniref:Uncharacterized protein n=1 Tax=Colocasia esculenta TaxID=4460 RepID=A0A843VCD0_COLES|nr:hypothetical protein [Colocasia esculenta]
MAVPSLTSSHTWASPVVGQPQLHGGTLSTSPSERRTWARMAVWKVLQGDHGDGPSPSPLQVGEASLSRNRAYSTRCRALYPASTFPVSTGCVVQRPLTGSFVLAEAAASCSSNSEPHELSSSTDGICGTFSHSLLPPPPQGGGEHEEVSSISPYRFLSAVHLAGVSFPQGVAVGDAETHYWVLSPAHSLETCVP